MLQVLLLCALLLFLSMERCDDLIGMLDYSDKNLCACTALPSPCTVNVKKIEEMTDHCRKLGTTNAVMITAKATPTSCLGQPQMMSMPARGLLNRPPPPFNMTPDSGVGTLQSGYEWRRTLRDSLPPYVPRAMHLGTDGVMDNISYASDAFLDRLAHHAADVWDMILSDKKAKHMQH